MRLPCKLKAQGKGKPLDLLIKDLLPEKAGSFEGDLVVANFGKAGVNSAKPDVYASILSCVAVAIAQDILVIGMTNFKVPKDVAFIGTPVARLPPLRNFLSQYSEMIGKKPNFPQHGEFALALGAYHSQAK